MNKWMNTALSAAERAKALLDEMTLDEKLQQLKSQLMWPREYEEKRDFTVGSMRNIGHFMHEHGARPASEAAAAINEDTRRSIEASRLGIPVLQNGEALHGAEWVNGTLFPQSLAMAATYDDALVEEVADAIGKELRAGGVRQVFAPVVNITRDCRWGRTEEGYGEDVLLNSRMGAAFCRGLEGQNVIATPKHFVDNYGDGGRDSCSSLNSMRTLREVFLEPFRACFQEGGARSVMMAYNAIDGVPCSCNEELMQKILRDEWGFEGFTVSDYGGMEGTHYSHGVARDEAEAAGKCLKAGLDADMPNGGRCIKEALERGLISEEDIDKSVLRILTQKFRLGLFEEPFVDAAKADETVRCDSHRELSYKAALKCMTLLKNDGLLPLKKGAYRRIGLFGPAIDTLNGGDYSGPYGGWTLKVPTILDELRAYVGEETEIVLCADADRLAEIAASCDVNIYAASMLAGEGADRCEIKLPGQKKVINEGSAFAQIIDAEVKEIYEDQESMLGILGGLNVPLCVVLTGNPVDVSAWEGGANAILEAWFPGEVGSKAIVRTLFGENNPGGKLPISFPRCVGQLPLYYSYKPMGRPIYYVENDGTPYRPFGFGLSYTTFELSDFKVIKADNSGAVVSVRISNTGNFDGDEVLQLYISQKYADAVRPLSELKAFRRVSLKKGESKTVELELDARALSFYDAKMNFGVHPCLTKLMLGTSSADIAFEYSYDIL